MVNLHGKTFTVADALRRFDRIEQLGDPEAIKQAMPWVREAQDSETGRTRLYVNGGGGRTDRKRFTEPSRFDGRGRMLRAVITTQSARGRLLFGRCGHVERFVRYSDVSARTA